MQYRLFVAVSVWRVLYPKAWFTSMHDVCRAAYLLQWAALSETLGNRENVERSPQHFLESHCVTMQFGASENCLRLLTHGVPSAKKEHVCVRVRKVRNFVHVPGTHRCEPTLRQCTDQ